jgi:predicted aspartyl protease
MLGETRVKVRVHGPKGYVDLEMIANTGATLTKIPAHAARSAGLASTGSVTVKLVDGTKKKITVAEAVVEVRGDKSPARVLIGSDDQVPLLGLTSLETLGLKVNPVERVFEPTEITLYGQKLNNPHENLQSC